MLTLHCQYTYTLSQAYIVGYCYSLALRRLKANQFISRQKNMAHIPVIDISSRNPQAPQQLLEAASTYGFVYVENDEAGLSPQDIAHAFDLSKDFFAAPIEIKERAAIPSNKAGSNYGWLKQGVETLDPASQKRPDVKE